jgi:ubiquinone/menaquinone biosynthesis C-methylase UbiE
VVADQSNEQEAPLRKEGTFSMPTDQPQSESTYVIDAENAAEMARLMNQDRLFTKNMGGLFSEHFDLSNMHDILDIACGPGGWVLDVAHAYPKMNVVGIDISRLTIEYARAQAKVQWLNNASFRVMDATKPLDFPDNSFDMVNARLLAAFMRPAVWPHLVGECLRITRPGGIIRLTECEMCITNSLEFEKLNGMSTRALQLAGQSFSPDGRNLGITPMLGRLLRDAGCIDIQKKAHVIDFSAGTEAHLSQYQNTMVFFKLLQPFLIKLGLITQEDMDRLYQGLLAEMMSDDFCGVWFYLSVWGEVPAK